MTEIPVTCLVGGWGGGMESGLRKGEKLFKLGGLSTRPSMGWLLLNDAKGRESK